MPGGLLHFLVGSVTAAGTAELFKLKPVLIFLFIFSAGIIPILTLTALQRYNFAHDSCSEPLRSLPSKINRLFGNLLENNPLRLKRRNLCP